MNHFLFLTILSLFTVTATERPHQRLQYSANPIDLSTISLQTTQGGIIYLSDIKKQDASVFIFFSPECPLSQNYTLTLHNLMKKFAAESIKFYPVIPGNDFPLEEIKEFETTYNIAATVLMDNNYVLTKALAATVTPEAIVIDRQGKKVYQGKIDNWAFALGKKRQVITEHYVEDALSALLENRPIATRQTTPVGCFIYAQGHE